ncbi:hypothetical protein A2U01_0097362, partial [Trifolium medium]|nr:hypothetical protein [Trifolium medium]
VVCQATTTVGVTGHRFKSRDKPTATEDAGDDIGKGKMGNV